MFLILTVMSALIAGMAGSSTQRAWQIMAKETPKFYAAISKYTPHIQSWLSQPDSHFTIFCPVDTACSIDELSESGLNGDQMDAIIRYHLASERISLSGRPDLLDSALYNFSNIEPFLYLPKGLHQKIKVYREKETGKDKVFDGEIPAATVIKAVSCVDGLVVLVDRILFPPLTIPNCIADSTAAQDLLQSVMQFGMADYRSTPLTLLVPADPELGEAMIRDAQAAGVHACPGLYYSKDLREGVAMRTLTGARIVISDDGHNYYANGVPFLFYDIFTSFGVVHVLDSDLAGLGSKTHRAADSGLGEQRSYAVRPSPSTLQQHSSATCMMIAGGVAVCMAIGYIAWRRINNNY